MTVFQFKRAISLYFVYIWYLNISLDPRADLCVKNVTRCMYLFRKFEEKYGFGIFYYRFTPPPFLNLYQNLLQVCIFPNFVNFHLKSFQISK